MNLHSIVEAAEVSHLRAEDEVSQLRECQEDDGEHDGEPGQILSTAGQRG